MIKIMKIEQKELAELTGLAILAFTEDKEKYGQYPPIIDVKNHTLRFINNGHTFKITKENKMIGGAVVFNEGHDVYLLGTIFIDPACQNQGIGRIVLPLIEAEFPNAKRWKLDTPYLSFRNHHFYEKMGYKKVGEEVPNKNNKEFKLFLYEKRISLSV